MLDKTSNFAKTNISPLAAGDTSLTLAVATRFPDPALGNYNVVIWRSSAYANPADDPEVEIVRMTAKNGGVYTITRAQEGTDDVNHNEDGEVYSVAIAITSKMIDDVDTELDGKLKLDQTTPQTIVNGVPLLKETRNIEDPHSLVDRIYVDNAVTSLGQRFYMLSTASGVEAYYNTSMTPSEELESTVTAINPADGAFVAGWISPSGQTPTKLLAGIYSWNIFIAKSGGNKTFRIYWTLVERKSDDSEVVIATSADSNLIGAKIRDRVTLALAEDYTPSEGSRVIGKIYVKVISGSSATNLILYSEGNSDSHWEVPTNREILDQIYASNQHNNDNHSETYITGITSENVTGALGYTPEDVANKSTDGTFADNSDTKYPSQKAAKTYIDGKVANAINYRGAYNASGNVYPSTGGSGIGGAILKGNTWAISVAGTLGGEAVQVGDWIIANVDTPGQTVSNWDKLNTNISYVPEDSANKKTTITSSDVDYPTCKAVETGLSGKQATGSYEVTTNKKTTLTDSDTDYPTTKAVNTGLSGKQNTLGYTAENTSNKKTDLTDDSDTYYPTQKAVKTAVDTKAPIASPTFTGTVTLPKTTEINDTTGDHQYVLEVSELTADRTVTLPLLTGNDEFVFKDHTQTLTNKRIPPRVTEITSSANPTINTDNCDAVTITAQTGAITSMTTNLSGTPTNFQSLLIRIKDNGTPRAITWGTSFQSGIATLPTTTVANKTLLVGLKYDSVDNKWTCEAAGSRA